MKKSFFAMLFVFGLLFTFNAPVMARQNTFHFNATSSIKWTVDGFDYVYSQVTVPNTEIDSTHTSTKTQRWHIPFNQISSVAFTNTGDPSIAVAVRLKSEITCQDSESTYFGDSRDYTDQSNVCVVRGFQTRQDAQKFIDIINQRVGQQMASWHSD